MATFPYISSTGSIKRFLSHIQTAAVPAKLTQKYLEQSGFKSTNERGLIAIMRFIEFISPDNVPTDKWQRYRSRDKSKAVLGSAIRSAYPALFETFPDAHRKDNEALRNFFSAHTNVGEGALNYIVGTFRSLSEQASFESPDTEASHGPSHDESIESKIDDARKKLHRGILAVNINIELQIPATDNAEIYDKFFAAMKKHLFSPEAS
jgi:hypothetical protein